VPQRGNPFYAIGETMSAILTVEDLGRKVLAWRKVLEIESASRSAAARLMIKWQTNDRWEAVCREAESRTFSQFGGQRA
jgi:hypothetical protein